MKKIKSLKIGPFRYKIKYRKGIVANDTLCVGTCVFEKQEIHIKDDLVGVSNLDTHLHEILHVLWYHASLNETTGLPIDEQEKIVNALSPWLLMFLRDNKEFIKELQL